jgi:predicted acyl esterase
LARNRSDFPQDVRQHPLDDEWFRARTPDWSKIDVPFLSAANWGGQGLHPRGNFEAFTQAAAGQKWLEVHGDAHWTHFYTNYGLSLQKRFFEHFLKGVDNGWASQPRVQLNIRYPGERFVPRAENEWPLARTRWTRLYLDPAASSLRPEPLASETTASYAPLDSDGLTFSTTLPEQTEITGPIAARLAISSSTRDADLFLVVRVLSPNLKEVVFQGALDPHTPIAQGWLRASHRKLDKKLSEPYRPYHTHDEVQPLKPGEVYDLDIEIWPTSIVVPAGYRIALTVRGRDYVYPGGSGGRLSNMKNEFTGCGPFLHDDPRDRPVAVFGGTTTIHFGSGRDNYVLLPVIPPVR